MYRVIRILPRDETPYPELGPWLRWDEPVTAARLIAEYGGRERAGEAMPHLVAWLDSDPPVGSFGVVGRSWFAVRVGDDPTVGLWTRGIAEPAAGG